MLHVEHVSKTFFPGTINEKKALQDLSLHLEPGDFATVIGGNGAGKSTTLNAIAGVFPIDKGKIIIDGEDITKKPEHKRAKYIGRVFPGSYAWYCCRYDDRRKSFSGGPPRRNSRLGLESFQ